MAIVLEDNDSLASRVTIPAISPAEKYPIETCPALHRLISPQRLQNLVNTAIHKTATDLTAKNERDSPHIIVDYDLIIENERGITLFGYPLFSHQLFPLDPPKLMTPQGSSISSTQLYPLPSDLWKWAWHQWHVVMDVGDTDDQGWCYAWWYKAKSWKGRMKTGVVRRRIWMRVRWRPNYHDEL